MSWSMVVCVHFCVELYILLFNVLIIYVGKNKKMFLKLYVCYLTILLSLIIVKLFTAIVTIHVEHVML